MLELAFPFLINFLCGFALNQNRVSLVCHEDLEKTQFGFSGSPSDSLKLCRQKSPRSRVTTDFS